MPWIIHAAFDELEFERSSAPDSHIDRVKGDKP
jgi:hypothetical protein